MNYSDILYPPPQFKLVITILKLIITKKRQEVQFTNYKTKMTNFNNFKKLFILLFLLILNVFDTNSLLYIIFIRQYSTKTKYVFTNREFPLIYFKNKSLTLDISEIFVKSICFINKKVFLNKDLKIEMRLKTYLPRAR